MDDDHKYVSMSHVSSDSTVVQSLNKHIYGLPVSAPPIFPQTNMGRIRWHISSNPKLRCWILRASYICEPACHKRRYDSAPNHCLQAQGDATPSWYGTSRVPDCQLCLMLKSLHCGHMTFQHVQCHFFFPSLSVLILSVSVVEIAQENGWIHFLVK